MEFLEGWGDSIQFMGGIWIFFGTTQYENVDQLLSQHVSFGGCLIDDCDCGIVIANEYENVDQFFHDMKCYRQ